VLVSCALTGRKVLPSELGECAETRRQVGVDRLVTCAFTGARVADDWATRSAFSNKPLRSWIARRSEASGRLCAPAELVLSRTGIRALPDELDRCPCCGEGAVLRPLTRHERFECPSCELVTCALDRRPSGQCALCEAALAMTERAEPPAEVRALAPTITRWFAGRGAGQTVWVGRPGALRLFTRRTLVRATNDGRPLATRRL
jgi:hypothetical protein